MLLTEVEQLDQKLKDEKELTVRINVITSFLEDYHRHLKILKLQKLTLAIKNSE